MYDQQQLDALVAGLSRTSDRIRTLHGAGVRKSEIASYLGLEPNHVYSTISRDKARVKGVKVSRSAGASAPNPEEIVVMVHTNEKGELVLPASVNAALRLGAKEQLVVFASPGHLTLMTREKATLRLQETVRKAAPQEAALAAALLQIDADTRS